MERQTAAQYRDEKGNVILPLTVTETVFQQLLPEKSGSTKEEIVIRTPTGIGLESEDALPSC